jgi:hypothetical protein
LAVDCENVRSAIRRERRLGEDKAIFGPEVVDESSALGAEDPRVGPAAMKTKDAGKMQRWTGDYDRFVWRHGDMLFDRTVLVIILLLILF